MAAEEEIQDEAAVQHQFLDRLDLHLVPAAVQELVVLVVEGITGDVENPLLEFEEFVFELGLVHRTIVRFVNVSFHAVKIRHNDAKEWQYTLFVLNRQTNRDFIKFVEFFYWFFVSDF